MALSIASKGERILQDRADVFHLLRRLAFAATPQVASAIPRMPAARAVAWLINSARHADHPRALTARKRVTVAPLAVVEPPLVEIRLWASACGQRLFNTPNQGCRQRG